LLAGLLFFPRAGEAWAGYNPLAFDVLRPLGVFIELPGKDMPTPDVGAGLARIWSVDGLHAIGLGLLTLVGIVTLFGLRGRWTLWTVTLLVLLTALLPILATHVADAPLAEAGTTDLLSLVGTTGWTLLFALTLILLAGLLSLLGVGGPWTVGVAGVGLGTLTLVVASRYYVMGLASNPDAAPFWAGLAGAAIWLGPGLGAMLAPLAAGVVDQQD
jgi:hypothetical protein